MTTPRKRVGGRTTPRKADQPGEAPNPMPVPPDAPPGMAPDGSGGFRVDETRVRQKLVAQLAEKDERLAMVEAAFDQSQDHNRQLLSQMEGMAARIAELEEQVDPVEDDPQED